MYVLQVQSRARAVQSIVCGNYCCRASLFFLFFFLSLGSSSRAGRVSLTAVCRCMHVLSCHVCCTPPIMFDSICICCSTEKKVKPVAGYTVYVVPFHSKNRTQPVSVNLSVSHLGSPAVLYFLYGYVLLCSTGCLFVYRLHVPRVGGLSLNVLW